MNHEMQQRRAEALRALHHGTTPLVLINAWDVVSARLVERAGARAIATTSAGVAWTLGYPDGERVPRDEMLAMVERIARSVSLPVTADLESGYGPTPSHVAETVRLAIAAGAVGMNLEDGDVTAPQTDPLFDVRAAVERVAAARAAADASGIAFVINARTDVFLLQVGPPELRLQHAIDRANAYRAAGADSLFVPGVHDADTIATLAREIAGPLNILAVATTPPVAELARAGVARISLGSASTRAALSAMARSTAAVFETGHFESMFDSAFSHHDVDTVMQ